MWPNKEDKNTYEFVADGVSEPAFVTSMGSLDAVKKQAAEWFATRSKPTKHVSGEWKKVGDRKFVEITKSDLKEFTMNMPMIGITGVGATPDPAEAAPSMYDITASTAMPAEVSAEKVDHIYVGVESASVSNYNETDPMVCVDLVMTVTVTDPDSGRGTNYKMVKRLKLDKAKLAYEAESLTPVSVTEAEDDPVEVAKIMHEFHASKRAREMAGLAEPVGTKTFKLSVVTEGEIKTLEVPKVRSEAHARYVFETKHASMYPGVKILRATEVA